MAEHHNLSNRQKRAIAALLSCRNVQAAAQAAQVGQRTLYRWMTDIDFRAALLEAEGEAIDAATRRLIGMQDEAIGALAAVLNDVEVGPAVRIRAAQAVLDNLLKLRELRNLETRINHLEEVIYESR